MVSLTHFSHEHPLILLKQLKPEEEYPRSCYACEQSLCDSEAYACEICKSFLLHKSCAELPMEIVHKSHEQHSLFLLSELPAYYVGESGCDLCGRCGQGFLYHCYLCDFDLDIKCAFEEKENIVSSRKDLTLYHPSHRQHLLKLEPKPSSFRCDACDVKDEDLSYHCISCSYWIHRLCAMLPSPTSHVIHRHPLSLAFHLPSQYHNFNYLCFICRQKIDTRGKLWLYYCELCRCFVHIKCMNPYKFKYEFPVAPIIYQQIFSLIDIQVLQLQNISLLNVEKVISIISHKHPLRYSNDQQILEDEDEDGEEVLCDGCIERIESPPYYHCAECRYFLHLPCANLCHELETKHHPHPLTRTSKTRFYDKSNCNLCNRQSNGFFFCCTTEGCDFNLDVKCASLLKDDSLLDKDEFKLLWRKSGNCTLCGEIIYHSGLGSYHFRLHLRCIMLPKSNKHIFDSKHRLSLRRPPHYYHPGPFDCAECEKEIDPNYWLYHCEECDLSFHVYCIDLSWRSNNSKFGQKLKIDSHLHPLKYVYKASVRSTCHGCGSEICDYFALECETCNYHLCRSCVQKIEP